MRQNFFPGFGVPERDPHSIVNILIKSQLPKPAAV